MGRGAAGVPDEDGDRDDRIARERDDQQEPENPVHPVVAEDRQQRREQRGGGCHHAGVPAECAVQSGAHQYLVGDVEGHIGE
jgi:hypothetical protein